MANKSGKYPIKHLIGFLLSIVLTLLSVWAALGSDLPVIWIIAAIMLLAVIQAGIQLFMFMHMVETKGVGHAPWNMMFHGFVVATIIVSGSLFTMSFGFTHDHDDGGDHQHEEQQEMQEDHSGH